MVKASAATRAIKLIPATIIVVTSVYAAQPTIVPTDSGIYKGKYKETSSGYELEAGNKSVTIPKAAAEPVAGGRLVIKNANGIAPFGCAHACCPSGDCDTTCCADSAHDTVLDCTGGKANLSCKTF